MKKFILSSLLLFASLSLAKADQGMWMLPYLEKLNIKDIHNSGGKLDAKEIYSAKESSLTDAIVHFGGGCTGEVVSSQGLVFTNHHCGYGAIQNVSTMESDYLKSGFWAMERGEEIHCPGLTVKFIRHIIDITEEVEKGSMNALKKRGGESDMDKIRKDTISQIVKNLKKQYPGMDVSTAAFFGDSQYMAFVTEIYKDVRLVGAPPTFIGKFGGETDNWMWPRHTGDFAVFRVYADKNGRAAEYSHDNTPLVTPKFLEISAKGYEQGDFAMIMGFPGSTQRYMTSYELDKRMYIDNAIRIGVRGIRQEILKKRMNSSDKIRLQYAAKYAGSSNYWKNSIGMNRSLVKHGIKARKEAQEQQFGTWAQQSGNDLYKNVLPEIEKSISNMWGDERVKFYLSEAIGRSIEMIAISNTVKQAQTKDKLTAETKDKLLKIGENFYKDFDVETDRAVASAMLRIVRDSLERKELPTLFESEIDNRFGGDIDAYLDDLYSNSIFKDIESFNRFVEQGALKQVLNSDPAMIAFDSYISAHKQSVERSKPQMQSLKKSQNLFIKGTLAMNPSKIYYPDANSTIRLTYGNILPYDPADAVSFRHYTTLSGVMAKEDPNVYEFTIPQRLKDLYRAKDFGPYSYKGDIPVCFISNNDITGGNSGSPVLDAYGRLLGLAFDGNWEAMSGDIMFEPDMQRCINVDIRYVLFIIDKYANSPIINELKIVN